MIKHHAIHIICGMGTHFANQNSKHCVVRLLDYWIFISAHHLFAYID